MILTPRLGAPQLPTTHTQAGGGLASYTNIPYPAKFENSWKEIAKELNVSVNPRLDSNRVKKDYKQKIKFSELSEDFKIWHKSYNKYDYLLYEEFCTQLINLFSLHTVHKKNSIGLLAIFKYKK